MNTISAVASTEATRAECDQWTVTDFAFDNNNHTMYYTALQVTAQHYYFIYLNSLSMCVEK